MRVRVEREEMTLDLVVWQALGRQDDGLVEQALALNPGIAAHTILAVGREVELPEATAPQPVLRETVRLWG